MNRQLLAISFLTFVHVLGFSLMVPVFPYIVEQFGGNAVMYGLLVSSYSMFQFIGAPLLGSLGDKYGRRPVLAVCQIMTFVGWVVFALSYFVPNTVVFGIALPLFIIMVSRVIDGSTGGSISVANAYIADISESHEKTRAFGTLGVVGALGFVAGPVLGAYTSSFDIGYLGTVYVALIISFLSVLFTLLYLPESLPRSKRLNDVEISVLREINIFTKLIKLRDNTVLYRLFFIRIFCAFVFTSYTALIVLYIKDSYAIPQQLLGPLYLLAGMFIIVNQLYVTKLIVERSGERKTFGLGMMLMAVGLIFIGLFDIVWVFIISLYLLVLGTSLAMITFKSLITTHSDPRKQGEVNGLDESIIAGAAAVGPLLSGYIYEAINQYSFFILGLVLFVPYLVFYIRTRKVFV